MSDGELHPRGKQQGWGSRVSWMVASLLQGLLRRAALIRWCFSRDLNEDDRHFMHLREAHSKQRD